VGDELAAVVGRHPAVAVHFWAAWNGWDPPMERSIQAIAGQFAGRVVFVSCDADRPENAALCRQLGVVNMPALAIFVSGVAGRLLVGYRQPEELAREIEARLARPGRPSWWRFWQRRSRA
jgi:thioredoxin-like negative regulator of GroEL